MNGKRKAAALLLGLLLLVGCGNRLHGISWASTGFAGAAGGTAGMAA